MRLAREAVEGRDPRRTPPEGSVSSTDNLSFEGDSPFESPTHNVNPPSDWIHHEMQGGGGSHRLDDSRLLSATSPIKVLRGRNATSPTPYSHLNDIFGTSRIASQQDATLTYRSSAPALALAPAHQAPPSHTLSNSSAVVGIHPGLSGHYVNQDGEATTTTSQYTFAPGGGSVTSERARNNAKEKEKNGSKDRERESLHSQILQAQQLRKLVRTSLVHRQDILLIAFLSFACRP